MNLKYLFLMFTLFCLFHSLFSDEIHVVQRGDTLLRLAARYGVTVNEIREMNRLSNDQIRIGQRLIVRRNVSQTPIYHTVRAGDNLTNIARRHNTTVAQIREWNELRSSTIHANQRLIVGFEGQAPTTQRTRFHIVQSGETLSAISRRHDVDVLDLMEFNKLSGFTIFPGQRIWLEDGHVAEARAEQPTIPLTPRETGTPTPATHTVRRGENLFRIALLYNVTVDDLRRWNRITNDNIRVGQVLQLREPSGAPRPVQESRIPLASGLPRAVLPVTNVQILSEFGMRSGRMHKGIDFGGSSGTPIFAVLPGIVRFSGVQRGYGNMVIIEHDNNIMTVYAHNESNLVTEGQQVTQGQVIATIGRTGNASVPHVHFEFRVGRVARNPRELLRL